jgi:hypothetical protein
LILNGHVTVFDPSTALTVIPVLAVSPTVDALNVALVAPEETVTVGGSTNAGLVLESVTTSPPGPAGLLSVTVPTDVAPPKTDAGDIDMPMSFAA